MVEDERTAQLAAFLDDVRRGADSQREVLLDATTGSVTGTQGHVLMLLAQQGPLTNTELARALQVSPAAVTKAMHGLRTALVTPQPDVHDGRINRWQLTADGREMATVHAHRHAQTLAEYAKVLANFTTQEQDTISKFIELVTARLDA